MKPDLANPFIIQRRKLLICGLLAAALPAVIPAAPLRAEVAVAPEKNPPGDIPDSQAFVDYASDAGYALKVPEGWARSGAGTSVKFVDKLDGVSVTLSSAASPPTIDWVKLNYLPALTKTGRAVKILSVSSETLPGGSTIRIAYSSNSDPNPVTNKQIRLENNRYLFFKDGNLAALDLYAPLGSDNVDQWQLMSRSFRWR